MKKLLVIPMALAIFLSVLSGCAASGATSYSTGLPGAGSPTTTQPAPVGGTATSSQAGQVQIVFTDAPRSDNVTKVLVTVSEVQIHEAGAGASENQTNESNGGWITANITGPNPFDLLTLSGGLQEILGGASLASGNYTQVRLAVSKVQVEINGVLKDAEVPSGTLKFVEPFEVQAGQTTGLLFDFDAQKSVVIAGDGKIIVKPVIKLTVEKPGLNQGQAQSVKIVTPTLPNGTDNVSYTATVRAAGGTGPYVWAITAGNLTDTLTINPNTGVISGTPNVSGNFTFTVTVQDSSTPQESDSRQYSISIFSEETLSQASGTELPAAMNNGDQERQLHIHN